MVKIKGVRRGGQGGAVAWNKKLNFNILLVIFPERGNYLSPPPPEIWQIKKARI